MHAGAVRQTSCEVLADLLEFPGEAAGILEQTAAKEQERML